MNIFFDFDDVLFNTRLFSRDFKKVFYDCGVRESCFEQTYAQARKTTRIPNYNFDKHLEILSTEYHIDSTTLQNNMNTFLCDTSQYIFSDVAQALSTFKKGGYKLFLVSYGVPRSWQEKKVHPSGIADIFDQLVIGEIDKGHETKKILDQHPSGENFFIDDREAYLESVKKVNPDITTILMKRKEGRHTDDQSIYCDQIAHTLKEVDEIIAGK